MDHHHRCRLTSTISLKFVIIMLVILISTTQLANAQGEEDPTQSNFQPSLFVVIGVLSFMFSLTFALLIYARFCHRHPSAIHNLVYQHGHHHHHGQSLRHGNVHGMFGISTRFSGINKEVVESLPLFRFSTLKGSKQGLQCSVCLTEFGDTEILRLLPKCKHGFHIECIDKWLEIHSSCPLCRQKVTPQDLAMTLNSSSMRFLLGGKPEDQSVTTNFESSSNILELFIEREEHQEQQRGSSRSFNQNEEELPIKLDEGHNEGRILHRLNHQIVVSDVMFKNRWSNVSSSDLMFLNSEMIGVMSSDRFHPRYHSLFDDVENNKNSSSSTYYEEDDDHYRIMNVKEEMERKRMFEHKVMGQMSSGVDESSLSPPRTSSLIPADKRSMSEITALSRNKDSMSMKKQLRQCLKEPQSNRDDDDYDNGVISVREEDIKRRRIWFPIARRTVQWFVNREKNRPQQHQQQSQETEQHTLDV